MDTVIRQNVNPVERVERSAIVLGGPDAFAVNPRGLVVEMFSGLAGVLRLIFLRVSALFLFIHSHE